ncbi:MAG: hypothetical protein ACYTGN_10965 [Planctomycetota bacterium]|jgi:hypothetical protein
MSPVLALHAGATLYMAGLIWFVQVVHYPLFAAVGRDGFQRYEGEHTRLTGWVVGPPMILELVTSVLLALLQPGPLTWTGLALVVVIWLSTALLQMPAHRKLMAGFDASVQQRLVKTNWLRTAAWSARGVLALLLLSA